MEIARLDTYRLTTAEITYRLPDFPSLLQTFVLQIADTAPTYPGLRKFLDFWQSQLDGQLHSVRIGSAKVFSEGEKRQIRHFSGGTHFGLQ